MESVVKKITKTQMKHSPDRLISRFDVAEAVNLKPEKSRLSQGKVCKRLAECQRAIWDDFKRL